MHVMMLHCTLECYIRLYLLFGLFVFYFILQDVHTKRAFAPCVGKRSSRQRTIARHPCNQRERKLVMIILFVIICKRIKFQVCDIDVQNFYLCFLTRFPPSKLRTTYSYRAFFSVSKQQKHSHKLRKAHVQNMTQEVTSYLPCRFFGKENSKAVSNSKNESVH
jgi:hypothetical protein